MVKRHGLLIWKYQVEANRHSLLKNANKLKENSSRQAQEQYQDGRIASELGKYIEIISLARTVTNSVFLRKPSYS